MIRGRARSRTRRYGRRNPRNAPWGSTSAEASRLDYNPRKRASSGPSRTRTSAGSGTYLGKLVELVYEVNGKPHKITLTRKHLAWVPSQRALAIVVPSKARPGTLDGASRKTHLKFHASAVVRTVAYEWPTPVSSLKLVGLIRSLTYVVPEGVKSPVKHGYRWVHAFGDHGESGHGPMRNGEKVYPDRLKPALKEDAHGNLYIVRRPGNKFNVTDWIYW